MSKPSNQFTPNKENSLRFHAQEKKGKLHVGLNKNLATGSDLSLAYSPGVGFPCLEIQKDPLLAYEYTSKANFVAVISNGTAVLGFGNLGAMASKPVMEGKSALFKRFADIDSIDIEVDTMDVESFISTVKNIGETWGGINLEDIKAPECFEIETRLKKDLKIPVFHDDQHGTAVITLAGLINVAKVRNKDIKSMKIVINGAGAAGISCAKLIVAYGVPQSNIIMCDTKGVIYKGRTEGMNQWKEDLAVSTDARTLEEAAIGADVLIGLSSKGAFTETIVKSLAKDSVIFAMANPDPEITPEEVRRVRSDIIIATGRSDYPNQINNVMCFPYLFRGALDVRATEINIQMQLAAANAISKLAQEHVPDSVKASYIGRKMSFGPEYIVPTSFDPRLLPYVASEVAKVAMETGVARVQIDDLNKYKKQLGAKRVNMSSLIGKISSLSQNKAHKVVFSDANSDTVEAAIELNKHNGTKSLFIGNSSHVTDLFAKKGIVLGESFTVMEPSSDNIAKYNAKESTNASLANAIANGNEVDRAFIVFDKNNNEMPDMFNLHILSHVSKTIFVLAPSNKTCESAEEISSAVHKVGGLLKKLEITPLVAITSGNKGANDNAVTQIKQLGIENAVANLCIKNVLNIRSQQMSNMGLENDANVIVVPSGESAKLMLSLSSSFFDAGLIGSISIPNKTQVIEKGATSLEIFNTALVALLF